MWQADTSSWRTFSTAINISSIIGFKLEAGILEKDQKFPVLLLGFMVIINIIIQKKYNFSCWRTLKCRETFHDTLDISRKNKIL